MRDQYPAGAKVLRWWPRAPPSPSMLRTKTRDVARPRGTGDHQLLDRLSEVLRLRPWLSPRHRRLLAKPRIPAPLRMTRGGDGARARSEAAFRGSGPPRG